MFTTINYVNEQNFVFFLGQEKKMTSQAYTIDRTGDWLGMGHLFNIWVSDLQPRSILTKATGELN